MTDGTDTSSERFLFSAAASEQAQTDTTQRLEALETRVAKLVEGATIVGTFRVCEAILKMTTDPEELDRLGKALQRLAELVPQVEKLRVKQQTLALAKEEPQWMAFAFGEFTEEIEIDTHRFERGEFA